MYDAPYRLERDVNGEGKVQFIILRTGEGVVCKGTNWSDMRNLVDKANEAEALIDDRHR